MVPRNSSSLTRSVLKALDVLEFLHDKGAGLPPAEIAHGIGVSRPTAYRLLATMADRRWVMKDPQDPSKYRLGYRVLQMAGAYLGDLEIRNVAHPFMERLSQAYDESVRLFILDGHEVVFIDQVLGSHPVHPFLPLGRRGCLHSKAVGKAILAALPDEEAQAVVHACGFEPKTPHTITSWPLFRQELERVRRRGYGTADQEDTVNLRAVGAAILNFQGLPVAGLAISGYVPQLPDKRMRVLGLAARDTAAQISEQLGYEPHSPK